MTKSTLLPYLIVFAMIASPAGELMGQFRGGAGDGHHESSASAAASASLPLAFIAFTAGVAGDRVELDWQTEDELDTDYFTIERSTAGTEFTDLATLPAAGDARGYRLDYRYTDAAPLPGVSYYRIKTTDYDGALTYSSTVSVGRETPAQAPFSLYPNPAPAGEDVRIVSGSALDDSLGISLYEHTGRKVLTSPGGGGSSLPTADLSAGTYFIRVVGARATLSSRLIIVSR